MVNPYLADDEPVVLATENIRTRSGSYQALVLTDKRVLLIRTEGEKISAEEFLLSDLRSALVSQAAKDEPTLLLSYVTPRGEPRRESIVFVSTPEKRRNDEVREWAKKLSDQLRPLPEDGGTLMSPQAARPAGRQSGATRDGLLEKHGRLSGLAFPDIPGITSEEETPSAHSRKWIPVGALIIIVLVVLAGIFLLPHAPAKQEATAPVPTPAETPVPAATAEPVAGPTVAAVQSLAPSQVQYIVPSTGVWVRVDYAGNYTGTVGSGSLLAQVSDAGQHLYQQAVTTGSVRVIIDKSDASNRVLTADIYQDGRLLTGSIKNQTSSPYGEVNLQIDLAPVTPSP